MTECKHCGQTIDSDGMLDHMIRHHAPTLTSTASFRAVREPDDPLCLRASIGGSDRLGWYLVYRGDPAAILDMLQKVLLHAEVHLPAHPPGPMP